jgi:molybdopterin synthase catalytic subunit
VLLKVTDQAIDLQEALEYVRDPSCGAVAIFEGNIREQNQGTRVYALEYEVYHRLLANECETIYREICERWKIHRVIIVQRVGLLNVGETGVVICVSSGHRREALDALDYAIEEFKKRAPVWKKEHVEGAMRWINWTEHGKY